nr:hypothetical protein [Patescibacteria group bacterium]
MTEEFVQKHEKKIYRGFEILLGVLTWLLFFSPIWLGLIAPEIIIFYITFLTIYWSYLAFKHSYGIIVGYKKYREEMATDWLAEYKALDFNVLPEKDTLPASKDSLGFFVLIPVVNESENILRDSFNSLLAQTLDLKQILLVYTVEERYASEIIARIHTVTDEHKSKFADILTFVHPAGIP